MEHLIIKDNELKEMDLLNAMVEEENQSQLKKWGVQEHTPFQWLCYLTEEVGELAQAIAEDFHRERNNKQVYEEAIQVSTLALKIAEMYIVLEDEGNKNEHKRKS